MRWGLVIAMSFGCQTEGQPVGTATVLATLPSVPELRATFEASAAAVVTPTAVGIVVTNLIVPSSDVCAAPRIILSNGPMSGTNLFTATVTITTGLPLHVGTFENTVQAVTMTTDTCGLAIQTSPQLGDVSFESVGDTLRGIFRIHMNQVDTVVVSFNAPVCTLDADASATTGCAPYPRCGDGAAPPCVE